MLSLELAWNCICSLVEKYFLSLKTSLQNIWCIFENIIIVLQFSWHAREARARTASGKLVQGTVWSRTTKNIFLLHVFILRHTTCTIEGCNYRVLVDTLLTVGISITPSQLLDSSWRQPQYTFFPFSDTKLLGGGGRVGELWVEDWVPKFLAWDHTGRSWGTYRVDHLPGLLPDHWTILSNCKNFLMASEIPATLPTFCFSFLEPIR